MKDKDFSILVLLTQMHSRKEVDIHSLGLSEDCLELAKKIKEDPSKDWTDVIRNCFKAADKPTGK